MSLLRGGRRLLFAAASLFCLLPGPAGAGNVATPAPIVMGTATSGGGFEVYGRALAEAVAENDPGLVILPRATAGSLQNVPLLRSGTLDIALVQGTAVEEALADGQKGKNPLSILYALYSSPGLFAVRADQPYRTIDDLRGQAIAFGAAGSGLVGLARDVLGGLGWDMRRDFDARLLERAGDGADLVLNGEVTALWGAGVGWPAFQAVAAGPAGARFIGLDDEDIARVTARYPYLKEMSVPAGAYPGMTEAVKTVGPWSFIMVRPGFPEDLAYRLARALHLAEARLAARLPQGAETTAVNTVSTAEVGVLHPGAIRYFRDVGLLP
ncbi:TAXI family TRAP transporter solute-binding subunit [Telmatospirillum siberiense]|nr:TAXI family TRAP transporter solute-binding subunit [Telmatospirillum siberiense]